MTGTLTGIFFLALALLGTPLFVVVGGLALASFHAAKIDIQSVIVEMYRLAENPFLITIPLFTFAGFMMAESGTAKRLARIARAGIGWMPAGIVIGVIVACSFFTTISGASAVTIIALGGLMLPLLKSEGYPENFSLGICTAAGSMGLLFPPSLPLIVYGVMTKLEINKLFIAGILPGAVTVIVLSIFGIIVAYRAGARRIKVNGREFFGAVNEIKWEALVPVIIIGGVFGGIVTVGEMAAVTAAYVFIIEVFVYKDLKVRRDIPRIITKSMLLVGAILLILGCALGLTNYVVDAEVPDKIFEITSRYFTSRWSFLLALNVFLLIIGGFLDVFSAIIVVVPVIMPVALKVGIDPIHLAIIFIANLQVGYLMPPAGMDLLVASLAFDQPMTRMYRVAIPFVLVLFISLMVITYVPWLSLGLLN